MAKKTSDFVTRYCVFWIPSVTHKDLQSIEGSISDSYESSDRRWKYEVKSCVSISHTGIKPDVRIRLNIKETSQTKSSDNYEYEVELVSVDYSRNGLICFSYSISPFDDAKFNEPLRNKIYTQIKGHFHNHFYHSKTGGLKKGYYSDDKNKCILHKYDGESLRFYLHQIADMLSQESAFLLEELNYIDLDYKPNNESDAESYRKSLGLFLKRCQDLLGQFSFYSSLLNSKWNRSCTLNLIPKSERKGGKASSDSPDEDLHELAHNIYNTKDSLDRINAKVQSAFYLNNINRHSDLQSEIKGLAGEIKNIASDNNGLVTSIKRSNKLSSRLGWLSLIITLTLGSISIWQGCSEKSLSSEDINAISSRSNSALMDSIRLYIMGNNPSKVDKIPSKNNAISKD